MSRQPNEITSPLQRDASVVVKWYNPTKGFGFVQLGNDSPDAFLHVSVLEQSGLSEVSEGSILVCDITEGRKGPQVAAIHRVESYGAPAGFPSARPRRTEVDIAISDFAKEALSTVEGRVKFFNREKGFGFVCPDDGGKDVYISMRTLQRTGVPSLEPNQRVRLQTRTGQKGPTADHLELL